MFSAPNDINISRTTQALALIKAGDIEGFNKLVATDWYFIYVIFVIGVDALLIKSAGTFASWFNGSISDSDLVKPLWEMGTSAYKTTTSVVREIKSYAKQGYNSGREKGGMIDELFKKFSKRKENKNEE